jgi:hypothetical protein
LLKLGQIKEKPIKEKPIKEKPVRLAIIDDGFCEKIEPFKGKSYTKTDGELVEHKLFTFEGEPVPPTLGSSDYNDVIDGLHHGTAVAAIAAGVHYVKGYQAPYRYKDVYHPGGNVRYPGGIAPQAEVTCYRYRTKPKPDTIRPPANSPVASDKTTSANGGNRQKYRTNDLSQVSDSDPIRKILEEIAGKEDGEKFDVVSISVTMDQTDGLDKVIKDIAEQGTLIFAGTSNEGGHCGRGYPACLSKHVISVGSIDPKTNRSDFTWKNKPYCDVYTYGEVLVPTGERNREGLLQVEFLRGSSFATPAVAGLACLAIDYAIKKGTTLRYQRRNKIFVFFKMRSDKGKKKFKLKSAEKDFLVPIQKWFTHYTL